MPTVDNPLLRRLAGTALLCAAFWLAAPAPAAATVQRAVADTQILAGSDEQHLQGADELAHELHASTLRIDLLWSQAETSRGVYDDAGYLGRVVHLVQAARAQDVQVIITVYSVPEWASDSTFWGKPPSAAYAGYQAFYPMTAAGLDDFELFTRHLATLLQGEVFAYECWNEPNLWPFFFPQQRGGDGLFAAHTYVKYLKRFSAGIRAGDPQALVIAGATGPGGDNDRYRTAPQRFATVLESADDAWNSAGHPYPLFDGYSHHPYSIGGTKAIGPDSPAANPGDTVNLANIATLLKILPDKPFYLTEYGYNTELSSSFAVAVSEVDQARYLKQAFRLASRHHQIKLLAWFLLSDWSTKGDQYSSGGVYTGLHRLGGGAKRAWYAFARGNKITIRAPLSARRGALVHLRGSYTCTAVGGVKGKPLLLQGRWASGSWVTLRTLTTGENGSYGASVKLGRSTRYRLVFQGVVTSAAVLVRAR